MTMATPLNTTAACGALFGIGVTVSVAEASAVPVPVPEDEASSVLSGVEAPVVLSGVEASVVSGVVPLAVVSEAEEALEESLVEVGAGVEVAAGAVVEVVNVTLQTSSTSKVNGRFLSWQFLEWRFRASGVIH